MFKHSYKIATVWGIPIKVHISLVVLFVVAAYYFADKGSQFGQAAESLVAATMLLAGLFLCIALHELGHSFVAIRKGCRVREITLVPFGGAAQMERVPTRPRDEILMAIAGPLVSVAIGALCLLYALPRIAVVRAHPLSFTAVILGLGVINFVLAGFNLIPAFPTDGGRIFRALLSLRLGRIKATLIAARLGQVISCLFILAGLSNAFGASLNDVMLIVVGVFLFTAARRELLMLRIQKIAQKQGFSFDHWPPLNLFRDDAPDADDVIISPPPYTDEPDSKARIQNQKRNPFSGSFGPL